MEPIVPSIFFYLIVIGFCEICRRGCDICLPHSESPWSPKMFLIEAIGALQLITCVYENQLVVQHYGSGGFVVTLFLLLNAHRLTNRGCILSPAAVSERYLVGQMGLIDCFGVVIAELVGGTFGLRLAGLLWQLGLSDQHLAHYQSFDCVQAYKTPIMMVAVYELVAVLLIRLINGYVSKHKPNYAPYVTSVCICLLLTIGSAVVGPVSLNALVAYGGFGGCEGISNYEHLVTYWLAPISGWIIGWQLEKLSTSVLKND